ncbi:MAG TPA: GNAT family N-acetyltransferase [Thermoanaerobaculia bacterium]|nr:GNAT family N-acetyltransferase [Thermoanaerobaculia bacterium]
MINSVPVLTTERLVLRMLEQSDFEEYAAIHMDPDVTRYTVRTQLSRMDAWRHLATICGHWHLRGFGMWGVFERDTNRLAGRVGFHQPDGWPDFELGWTIGKAFWGKGYAPEAARRCLDYAFEEMGRDHLISLIDPENVASIRVAEKIGETLQGEVVIHDHRLLVYGARK